jgi:TrmH family RNA methyltransferase
MISKSEIKHIRSLSIKKYRQKYKKFVVEGEKSVLEAIIHAEQRIVNLYFTENFLMRYNDLFEKYMEISCLISENELNSISNVSTNTTCLAIMEIVENQDLNAIENCSRIVYLDGISDPGNMGTIIRTCDWFGVKTIVCSENCVDIYNHKVLQSTMGSIFRMNIYISDFLNLYGMLEIQNWNFYAADLSGNSLYQTEFLTPLVLIIGSESHGISDEIRNLPVSFINIPGENDKIDSLNASISNAIILSEVSKQLNYKIY